MSKLWPSSLLHLWQRAHLQSMPTRAFWFHFPTPHFGTFTLKMRFAGKQMKRFSAISVLYFEEQHFSQQEKCLYCQIWICGPWKQSATYLTMQRGEYRNHGFSHMHYNNSKSFITDKHKSTAPAFLSLLPPRLILLPFILQSTLNAFKCKRCTQNHL